MALCNAESDLTEIDPAAMAVQVSDRVRVAQGIATELVDRARTVVEARIDALDAGAIEAGESRAEDENFVGAATDVAGIVFADTEVARWDGGAGGLGGMEDDEGMFTYCPPDVGVEGDGAYDYGTVSPPLVELMDARMAALAALSSNPSKPQSKSVEQRERKAAGPAHDSSEGEHSRESVSDAYGSDMPRVLGSFSTPPPSKARAGESRQSAVDGAGSDVLKVRSMISDTSSMKPPRNPKLTVGISIVVLVLAVIGMIVLYMRYPQLLMGG